MRRRILELLKEGPLTAQELSSMIHVTQYTSIYGYMRKLEEEGWIEKCGEVKKDRGRTASLWRLIPHVCETCCHLSVWYEDPDPGACGQGTLAYEECTVIEEMTDSDVEDANDGLCPMWARIVDGDDCDLFLQEAMP